MTLTAHEPQTLPVRPAAPTAARVIRGASALLLRNAMLVLLVALCAALAFASPGFVSPANLANVAVQAAIPLVLVVPVALLAMSGKVDLSIGSNVAFSAVLFGQLAVVQQQPLWLCVLLTMGAGAVIGALNAILVCVVGIDSLIVTLGSLAAFRGLAQVVAPDPVFGFPEALASFGSGRVLGVPNLALVGVAIVVLGWFVLNRAPVGNHVRAVGVNAEAAYLSGIPTRRISICLYLAVGAACGLAAVMTAARVNSVPAQTTGMNLEIDILTAVLLGGVALGGGRGGIRGLVVGVLFLGVLSNGLTLLNVAAAWSVAAKGLLLLTAAVMDRLGHDVRPRL